MPSIPLSVPAKFTTPPTLSTSNPVPPSKVLPAPVNVVVAPLKGLVWTTVLAITSASLPPLPRSTLTPPPPLRKSVPSEPLSVSLPAPPKSAWVAPAPSRADRVKLPGPTALSTSVSPPAVR